MSGEDSNRSNQNAPLPRYYAIPTSLGQVYMFGDRYEDENPDPEEDEPLFPIQREQRIQDEPYPETTGGNRGQSSFSSASSSSNSTNSLHHPITRPQCLPRVRPRTEQRAESEADEENLPRTDNQGSAIDTSDEDIVASSPKAVQDAFRALSGFSPPRETSDEGYEQFLEQNTALAGLRDKYQDESVVGMETDTQGSVDSYTTKSPCPSPGRLSHLSEGEASGSEAPFQYDNDTEYIIRNNSQRKRTRESLGETVIFTRRRNSSTFDAGVYADIAERAAQTGRFAVDERHAGHPTFGLPSNPKTGIRPGQREERASEEYRFIIHKLADPNLTAEERRTLSQRLATTTKVLHWQEERKANLKPTERNSSLEPSVSFEATRHLSPVPALNISKKSRDIAEGGERQSGFLEDPILRQRLQYLTFQKFTSDSDYDYVEKCQSEVKSGVFQHTGYLVLTKGTILKEAEEKFKYRASEDSDKTSHDTDATHNPDKSVPPDEEFIRENEPQRPPLSKKHSQARDEYMNKRNDPPQMASPQSREELRNWTPSVMRRGPIQQDGIYQGSPRQNTLDMHQGTASAAIVGFNHNSPGYNVPAHISTPRTANAFAGSSFSPAASPAIGYAHGTGNSGRGYPPRKNTFETITRSAENRKPSLSDRIADKFASGTEKMKNLFSGSSKKKTSDGDQWSNALESEIPRGSVNPKDGHEIYEGMPLAPRAPTPSSRLKTQQSMGRLRSYTAPGGQAPMRPSTSQGQHSRRNIPANRDNWAPYGDHQEGTAIGGQRGNTYQETSSRTTSRELQTRSRSRNDTTTSKNTDTTSLTSSYFYGENSPMFRRDANWQGPLPLTPRSSSLRRTHRVEPERANNSSPLERRSPSSTKRRSNDMKGYDARPPSPNAPKIDETMLRQVKEAQRRQL